MYVSSGQHPFLDLDLPWHFHPRAFSIGSRVTFDGYLAGDMTHHRKALGGINLG